MPFACAESLPIPRETLQTQTRTLSFKVNNVEVPMRDAGYATCSAHSFRFRFPDERPNGSLVFSGNPFWGGQYFGYMPKFTSPENV